MPETFEQAWRTARNLFPSAPPLLVRDWVQDAYVRICDQKVWGFLRAETFLTTQAARAVDVVATQGSATITSVGLFVAGDVGRQFRGAVTASGLPSTIPIYTILTVPDANTATLDQPFQATGGVLSGQILDAYVTCPADFGSFLAVVDPYNQRPIAWWFNWEQVLRADPAHVQSDSWPRFLVAHRLSVLPATLGRMQYQWWPYPTAARQYPALYQRRPERLTDDQFLPGVLGERPDVLRLGAQLQAAAWPGTTDLPNPYFNLGLSDRLTKSWELEVQRLSLRDDDQFPEQFMQVHWDRVLAEPAPTARWLRQTEATVSDYY